MSQREARNSTKSQRAYHLKQRKTCRLPQVNRSTTPTRPLVEDHTITMADANPKTPANTGEDNGGDAGRVPSNGSAGNNPRSQTPPAGGAPSPPGSTSPAPDKQMDVRVKNIEEILLDWKKEKELAREVADRAARHSRHSRTPSRHRRPSRHSGYSPSSRRSRSSRRSHSRHRSSRRSSRSRSRRMTRSRSRSRRRSSSRRAHRRSPSRPRPRHHSVRSTSSARDLSAPAALSDTELERALKLQYPDMGRPKGKPLPTYAVSLEPYRRLPPDLKHNAADRRFRRDLTFPEHMCGFLNLILRSVDESTEVYDALEHAAQVAEDAASVGWSDVRAWSQACFAYI